PVAPSKMNESDIARGFSTGELADGAPESDRQGGIPAGYTYLGQFVDHDITFDPASSLMRQNDPSGLLNHRTPRLDLDSVYGGGPEASPHLYENEDPIRFPDNDKRKFLIGGADGTALQDLPRNSEGRALIGEMRNDENVIVSQLHLAFLRAHNKLVEIAIDEEVPKADVFNTARQTLRWLYQYIIWNDFLKRITDPTVFNTILDPNPGALPAADKYFHWQSNREDIYHWKYNPFMPVEFSVAAYRFGHSMVRNAYKTNQENRTTDPNGDDIFKLVPLFDNASGVNTDNSLRGFRPVGASNIIQWDWFLDMPSSIGEFPQRARKIDTKLSNALVFLHEAAPGSPMNILALRNLQRGARFDLPSGTAVARKLGFTPIPVESHEDMLWFYILKEAEEQADGQHLGKVGSTIICAVFAGLLLDDPFSYFNMDPRWTPDSDKLLNSIKDDDDNPLTLKEASAKSGEWELGAIIKLSELLKDKS
ncbi:MAG: peroxidase family protein, partial [Aggregatilineales bacterium]